jgi:DNA-binding transcriptional LysR family regulator
MVAEARAVVSRLDEALEAARAVARRQAGRLAIAYVPRALQTLLPSALVRLRERFHDLVVDLTQTPGGEQGDALRSGRADLAFGDAPLSGEGLACRRVLREELAALVPDDARFAGREAIALADLAGETLVLHPRREYPTYYDTILRACAGAGFAPRVVHREAGQNCLALVAAGEGVLLVPAEAESAPPGLRLLRLTDTGGQLRYDLYAAWRPGDASPYARYVAEALPEVAD